MTASDLQKGDVIRAPWREYGDDKNLTGTVQGFKRLRGVWHAYVVWHGDGDVTIAGDESYLAPDCIVEKV